MSGVALTGYICTHAGKWLLRIVFLETVAGVPGMVAGMLRHMRSLRRMERDRGWIHTLLEEARMPYAAMRYIRSFSTALRQHVGVPDALLWHELSRLLRNVPTKASVA